MSTSHLIAIPQKDYGAAKRQRTVGQVTITEPTAAFAMASPA